MIRLMRYIFVLCVTTLSFVGHTASIPKDFNHVEVQLSDAIDQTRARELGFRHMLVRLSGTRAVLSNDVIKKSLRKSSNYLSQFSVKERGDKTYLSMRFDVDQVKTLLIQAEQPYWSEERHEILVWNVTESATGKKILWKEDFTDFEGALKSAAQQTGLNMVAPLKSISQSDISSVDIWGSFENVIAHASHGYNTDAVLVLRTRVDRKGNYNIRWKLYDINSKQLNEGVVAPDSGIVMGNMNSASANLLNKLGSTLSEKYALVVSQDSSNSILVQIDGVHNAADFFQLERYIHQLNSVATTNIERMNQNSIVFRVHLLAQQHFINEVVKHRRLTEKDIVIVEPTHSQPVDEAVGTDNTATEELTSLENETGSLNGITEEVNEASILNIDLLLEWK